MKECDQMKEEKIFLKDFKTIEKLKNEIRNRIAKHGECDCIIDDFSFDGASFIIRWRSRI